MLIAAWLHYWLVKIVIEEVVRVSLYQEKMAEASENVSFNSSGVEVFVDPDNEVFFGPVTQKEMELRKPLPRKTLHPWYLIII